MTQDEVNGYARYDRSVHRQSVLSTPVHITNTSGPERRETGRRTDKRTQRQTERTSANRGESGTERPQNERTGHEERAGSAADEGRGRERTAPREKIR